MEAFLPPIPAQTVPYHDLPWESLLVSKAFFMLPGEPEERDAAVYKAQGRRPLGHAEVVKQFFGSQPKSVICMQN